MIIVNDRCLAYATQIAAAYIPLNNHLGKFEAATKMAQNISVFVRIKRSGLRYRDARMQKSKTQDRPIAPKVGLPKFVVWWLSLAPKKISCVRKNIYTALDAPMRLIFYPKSVFLLGKIQESRGQLKQAGDSYRKFLSLWNSADRDLPELLEAKARLAKLVGA